MTSDRDRTLAEEFARDSYGLSLREMEELAAEWPEWRENIDVCWRHARAARTTE